MNLSNRLNPNNIHFDPELAACYKRMSKPEKEALWSRDREMQKQQVRLEPAHAIAPLCWLDVTVQVEGQPKPWSR